MLRLHHTSCQFLIDTEVNFDVLSVSYDQLKYSMVKLVNFSCIDCSDNWTDSPSKVNSLTSVETTEDSTVKTKIALAGYNDKLEIMDIGRSFHREILPK